MKNNIIKFEKKLTLKDYQNLHKDINFFDIFINKNISNKNHELSGSFNNYLWFNTKLNDIIVSNNNLELDLKEYNKIKDYFAMVFSLYIKEYLYKNQIDIKKLNDDFLQKEDYFRDLVNYFNKNNWKNFLKNIIKWIKDDSFFIDRDHFNIRHITTIYINLYIAWSLDINSFSIFNMILKNWVDNKYKEYNWIWFRIWQFYNEKEYLKHLNFWFRIKEWQELISISKTLDWIEKVKDFTCKKWYKFFIITQHQVWEWDCLIDIEKYSWDNIKNSNYIWEKEILMKINELQHIWKENIIKYWKY